MLMFMFMSECVVQSGMDTLDSLLAELSQSFQEAAVSGVTTPLDRISTAIQSLGDIESSSSDKHETLLDLLSLARYHVDQYPPLLPPTTASVASFRQRIEWFCSSEVLSDVKINLARIMFNPDAPYEVKMDCGKLWKIINNPKAMRAIRKASISLHAIDEKISAAADALNTACVAEAALGSLLTWHAHLLCFPDSPELAEIGEFIKRRGLYLIILQRERLGLLCNSVSFPVNIEDYRNSIPLFDELKETLSTIYLDPHQAALVAYWSSTMGFALREFQECSAGDFNDKFEDLISTLRGLLTAECKKCFPDVEEMLKKPIVSLDTFLARL